METAALLGGGGDAALRIGAALECVHCYSLVHDDLPAMDDDDLRRGATDRARRLRLCDSDPRRRQPADLRLRHHRRTGNRPAGGPKDRTRADAVARGWHQAAWLAAERLDLAAERRRPDERGITMLQAMKTGALIRFACEAGAIIAGAAG